VSIGFDGNMRGGAQVMRRGGERRQSWDAVIVGMCEAKRVET